MFQKLTQIETMTYVLISELRVLSKQFANAAAVFCSLQIPMATAFKDIRFQKKHT